MMILRVWQLQICRMCMNKGCGSYLVIESKLGRFYLSNN